MAGFIRRPSFGLVWLVLVVLGTAGFFAWGSMRPPLDEVWQMRLELRLGIREQLTNAERRTLQQALIDHPRLVDTFLEEDAGLISANDDGLVDVGYAYAIRRDENAPAHLSVGLPEGSDAEVEVQTRAGGQKGHGRVPYDWQAPARGPYPQLIEIRLSGGDALVELEATP